MNKCGSSFGSQKFPYGTDIFKMRKQAETVLETCTSKDKESSMCAPSSLVEFIRGLRRPALSKQLDMLISSLKCLLPNTRILVLVSFILRKWVFVQFVRELRHDGISEHSVESLEKAGKTRIPRLSSAYPILLKPALAKASDKVEQYMLKRRGPRIDPWGTPNEMVIESEKELPIFTLCVLPVRKAFSQESAEPVMLNLNWSILSSVL